MTASTLVDIATARLNCQRFANEHKVTFQDHGEVGFGRPCVGFGRGNGYIDYNPCKWPDLEDVWPPDLRLHAPPGIDAYHKHQCLAVLVHDDDYDTAIRQLDAWIRHLEAQGPVHIVQYHTGASGLQAVFTGVIGNAIRFMEPQ